MPRSTRHCRRTGHQGRAAVGSVFAAAQWHTHICCRLRRATISLRALLQSREGMYLRFVIADLDDDSERDLGIFHAVWKLRDKRKLHSFEEDRHDTLLEWFNEHLDKPTRFTASKPPFYRKQKRAISWFKDTAHEHLDRVRELVAILEHHGVSVRMLKASRVGYVVYEDEFQIVAEPFADTRC
jgi:hypothetical protein